MIDNQPAKCPVRSASNVRREPCTHITVPRLCSKSMALEVGSLSGRRVGSWPHEAVTGGTVPIFAGTAAKPWSTKMGLSPSALGQPLLAQKPKQARLGGGRTPFMPFQPASNASTSALPAVRRLPTPNTPLITSLVHVQIVEPGDVSEFVFHDGQQIDPIHRPWINGPQLLAAAATTRTRRPAPAWRSTNQPWPAALPSR